MNNGGSSYRVNAEVVPDDDIVRLDQGPLVQECKVVVPHWFMVNVSPSSQVHKPLAQQVSSSCCPDEVLQNHLCRVRVGIAVDCSGVAKGGPVVVLDHASEQSFISTA